MSVHKLLGFQVAVSVLLLVSATQRLSAQDTGAADALLQAAIEAADDNRPAIEQALSDTSPGHLRGMRFLVANMPTRDLRTLSSEFLMEHVKLAYEAREQTRWGAQIPDDVFLNNVLPYANVNEQRDNARQMLREKFFPSVKDFDSISQAAAKLNQEVFQQLNVKYSTKRRRADQGVLESIDTGLASCTGLSILLIDACRACGIPARFVGTPLWSDGSGNHSWVEIWDGGWHFTGAAEPTGAELDKAWFVDRASKAIVGDPRHGIFAVSFQKTDLPFPLVWARSDRQSPEVYAVEVTERYAQPKADRASGLLALKFRALGPTGPERCQANLVVKDAQGKVVFRGQTKNESFDANDHLTTRLKPGAYVVELTTEHGLVTDNIEVNRDEQLVTLRAADDPQSDATPDATPDTTSNATSGSTAVDKLSAALQLQLNSHQPIDWRALLEQRFANTPLSRAEAEQASDIMARAYEAQLREFRAEEHAAKRIVLDELEMKYDYTIFGDSQPRSLVISMHGGGGAPQQVNDRQWQNQQSLYELENGIYLAPRAPTDTWNLWHQGHIDKFFTRMIENMIALEGVDSDRVYITGYSAGGDGVFQLAPRMADQLAGAAMMAGHPNETLPDGLRNLPFTLHVGERDAAYQRNEQGTRWQGLLADLRVADPAGYEHWVEIHQGKGHWMDKEDAAGVTWMMKFTRNLIPEKVVWLQDDVLHDRFYWLAVPAEHAKARQRIVANRRGNRITIEQCDAPELRLLLRDDMLNLDQPVTVDFGESEIYSGEVKRTIADLVRTLRDKGDRKAMFSASLTVSIES